MDSFTQDEWRDGTVLAHLARIDDGEPETRAALEFCRTMRANWNFTPARVVRVVHPAPEVWVVGVDSDAPRHVGLVQFGRAATRVVVGRAPDEKEYVCPHVNGRVHPGVYVLFPQSK